MVRIMNAVKFRKPTAGIVAGMVLIHWTLMPACAEPLVAVTANPAAFPLNTGEEINLEATAHYADGSRSNVSWLASWSNNSPQCAGLSTNAVRGLASGAATITVTYAGCAATSVLSVYSMPFQTNYPAITGSCFGASAAAWAGTEGWTNFLEAGVHHMRMPIDLYSNTVVDSFFWNQYDGYVKTGQTYGVVMYGIVNPRKTGTNWPSVSSFTNNLAKIVEHYDGDGSNDMTGLVYPIKQWEICNEVQYHAALDSNNAWYGFGKTRYHGFLTNSLAAIREADPQSALLNGAQIAPPAAAILYEGTSTLWNVIMELGTGSIDAVSYHDYDRLLESDQAKADFEALAITNKAVWITEADMQWAWDKNNNLTQDDNARLLPQGFAYALARDSDKIIAASMRAGTGDPDMVKWGSLMDPTNGTRRSVYYAFRKLVEKFNYFSSAGTNAFQSGTNNYGLRFAVAGNPIAMFWSTSNCVYRYSPENTNASALKVTRSTPSSTTGVFVVEHYPVTNNQTTLTFSNTAIYVEELTNSCANTTDLDGDGMPDAWELLYYGSMTNMTATTDSDNDHFLDADEYVAGTDPKSGTSALRLAPPASADTSGCPVISWSSVTGKVYNVFRSTNLPGGFSEHVFTNVPATPVLNVKTDLTASGNSPYFYRVRVQ